MRKRVEDAWVDRARLFQWPSLARCLHSGDRKSVMSVATPPPQDPQRQRTVSATFTMLAIVAGWALTRHVLAGDASAGAAAKHARPSGQCGSSQVRIAALGRLLLPQRRGREGARTRSRHADADPGARLEGHPVADLRGVRAGPDHGRGGRRDLLCPARDLPGDRGPGVDLRPGRRSRDDPGPSQCPLRRAAGGRAGHHP